MPSPTSPVPASTAARCRSRLLDEAGVATISGTSFGAFGEGYLRFSYAASLGALEEAVERIRAWLERQGNSRSGFTGA